MDSPYRTSAKLYYSSRKCITCKGARLKKCDIQPGIPWAWDCDWLRRPCRVLTWLGSVATSTSMRFSSREKRWAAFSPARRTAKDHKEPVIACMKHAHTTFKHLLCKKRKRKRKHLHIWRATSSSRQKTADKERSRGIRTAVHLHLLFSISVARALTHRHTIWIHAVSFLFILSLHPCSTFHLRDH